MAVDLNKLEEKFETLFAKETEESFNNYLKNKFMAQKTAVEYLIQEIKNDVFVHSKSTKEWNEIFKQAKAMEKEQIIKAHGDQYDGEVDKIRTGERYYNDTYGSSEKV